MSNHGFTGIWIPAHVWLNKELSMQEKVMCAEISALSIDRPCIASDQYLSEFMDLSIARVKSVIKSCSDKGFIVRKTRMTQSGRKREMSCSDKYYKPPKDCNQDSASIENKPLQVLDTSLCKAQKQAIYNKDNNKEDNKEKIEWPSYITKEIESEIKSLRKAAKAPLTDRSKKMLIKQLDLAIQSGYTIDQCMDVWSISGWRSFEADWMKKKVPPLNLNINQVEARKAYEQPKKQSEQVINGLKGLKA